MVILLRGIKPLSLYSLANNFIFYMSYLQKIKLKRLTLADKMILNKITRFKFPLKYVYDIRHLFIVASNK